MLIIVEGLDATGKSTFVDVLYRLLRRDKGGRRPPIVLKTGPPERPDACPFQEYEARLYEHLDRQDDVICDRWHVGELAYGPVLRGHSRLDPAGLLHVELFLRRAGAVVVYLHQPIHELERRLETRGDDLISSYQLSTLKSYYHGWLECTILPTVALRDPGETEADEVIDLALTQEYANSAYPVYPESTLVGSFQPEVVLFGERRGGRPPHEFRSAFVPRPNTSGHYLLSHLPESLESRVALVNACETEDPYEVWRELGQPAAVALGREAHRALLDSGVPHATVPHPQFVRRFHHSRLTEYGRLIERVAGTDHQLLGWRGEHVDLALQIITST